LPLFCLVPRSEFEILDTWRSPGLRGTGSHDVRVAGAFVPTDFALNTGMAEGQRAPGADVNDAYIYRLPLFSVFPYNICSPSIGIARGAISDWIDSVKPRPERANMPTRQMRLAESCAEVDAAEALLLANAAELKRLAAGGTPIPAEFRAKCGRDLAYAAQLCMRAVDRLMGMVGAHGMSDDSDIARARADLYAAGNHAGLQWDRLAAGYGARLLGAEAPGGR
ncbi:MAG TPA: acyl-CoA dehydrogenase family protein, partial [Chloroflexota bacterium]|nr:acyl-CoA dehydrogenase family protein [Chloroflexota bacterium]